MSASVPLAVMLRKCKILAARLGHEPFKAWVEFELNGYPDGVELPPYRRDIVGQVKANLSGPLQRSVYGQPVPAKRPRLPEPDTSRLKWRRRRERETRIVGILIAGVSAIVNFAFIPVYPLEPPRPCLRPEACSGRIIAVRA